MNTGFVRKVMDLQSLLKFLAVGLCNTAATLIVIYVLKAEFGLGNVAANASGYIAGLMLSFVLNRNWTFSSSEPVLRAAAGFLLVFAVAYLANICTVLAAIHWFGVNDYLAHALGMPLYTVLFYLGSRNFVFRQKLSTVAG